MTRILKAAEPPQAPRPVNERLTELAKEYAADPERELWGPPVIEPGYRADLAALLPNLHPLEREQRFLGMVDWADQIAQGDEDSRGPAGDMWQAGVDGMAGEVDAALLSDILSAPPATLPTARNVPMAGGR